MPCPEYYHTGTDPTVLTTDMLPSVSLNQEATEWDKYIYFDLKTTGLRGRPDIIQIGAVGPNGEFNKYITPSQPIEEEVAELTGLTYTDGIMRHNGYPLQDIPIQEALEEFTEFLQSQPTCVLAAHQAHTFHARILHQVAQDQGYIRDMEEAIQGVLDTLEVFNELYPYSFNSLQALVSRYLEGRTQRHHALKDARDLRTLIVKADPGGELIAKHTMDFQSL